MAKKNAEAKATTIHGQDAHATGKGKPSALVDTRVVYCGDNLDQLAKLPGECVAELEGIDPL